MNPACTKKPKSLRLVNGITNWLSNRMQRAERRQAASVIVFARRVIKGLASSLCGH